MQPRFEIVRKRAWKLGKRITNFVSPQTVYTDQKAGVSLRVMQRSDLPKVMALVEKNYSLPVDVASEIHMFLDNRGFYKRGFRGKPRLEYYVAVDRNGNVIGHTGLYTVSSDTISRHNLLEKIQGVLTGNKQYVVTRLGWFSVDPSLQGTGVGKTILHAVEDIARKRFGADIMAIESDTSLKRAAVFYKKQGYRKGYSRVSRFFGTRGPMNSVYKDISSARPVQLAAGYSFEPILRKENAREAYNALKTVAGNDAMNFKQSIFYSVRAKDLPGSKKMFQTQFCVLKHDGKIVGVIDAAPFYSNDILTVRHLHATNPKDAVLLSNALAGFVREKLGTRILVVRTPFAKIRDLLVKGNSFKEALPNIPELYFTDKQAKEQGIENPQGTFYVKKLK